MGDGVHLDSGWESLHRSLPQGTLAPCSLLPSILLWLWLLRGQNTIRKMRLSTAYGGAGCEGWSGMLWGLTRHGIKGRYRDKIHCHGPPPLERGYEGKYPKAAERLSGNINW